MKKINKGKTWMISAVLMGSIAFMQGCGAADKPTEDSAEGIVIQEESSPAETQSLQAQTEGETETGTQTTVETEIQTETQTKTQTAVEAETELQTPQAESEKESEMEKESKTNVQAELESKESEVQEASPITEGSVSESDFAVNVKGLSVPLKGDMGAYAPLLGEPDELGLAKSCVEAGDDKVYTYGGVVIYTYITNGVDVITLIEITGSEALPSGIHIGSTKADVIAAYGSAYTEEGTELLYEMGDKTIGLQMDGDRVSFIELF